MSRPVIKPVINLVPPNLGADTLPTVLPKAVLHYHSIKQISFFKSLTIETDGYGKQCRPRSDEKSDQGLHCLLFDLHLLEALLNGSIELRQGGS